MPLSTMDIPRQSGTQMKEFEVRQGFTNTMPPILQTSSTLNSMNTTRNHDEGDDDSDDDSFVSALDDVDDLDMEEKFTSKCEQCNI